MQNHTKGHRDLTKMQAGESTAEYFEDIENELVSTQRKLADIVGYEPRYLAFPYGKSNGLFDALLNKYHYRLAFTVKRGSSPSFINNYQVNRSMIYGHYGLKEFQRNLRTEEKIN